MCGIAGFIDPNTAPEARAAAVDRMCDTMLRRGPDDAGREDCGGATLGMRRLAIFDPANGHQPMRTSDGRFTLVFNGAIYNFAALRHELAGHGWSFHDHRPRPSRPQCQRHRRQAANAPLRRVQDVLAP
jgi:asparagine synthase (glutamine-hydrolysing)